MELIKPTVIARRALATLYNTTLLAGLVFRDYDEAFSGKVGDTVNVRKPATFTANVFDRAQGIQLQDPRETSFPVRLDTILDVSFPVTSEELTLEIDEFDERLLTPAMEAIVQDLETRLAVELVTAAGGGALKTGVTATAATDVVTSAGHGLSNGELVEFTAKTGGAGITNGQGYYVRDATNDTFKLAATYGGAAVDITSDLTAGSLRQKGGGTVAGTTANKVFRNARALFGRNKVPMLGRGAILSPEGASDTLGDDLFVAADKSGWTDALREGAVGRAFSFDTFESQGIGPNETAPRNVDGVAFHKDAVALVTRTLEKPMGVAGEQFAVANYKGLGLRVVRDYDIDKKQDVISIDFLLGTETIRPSWAAILDLPAA